MGELHGGNAKYRAPEANRTEEGLPACFTGKQDVYGIGLVIAELVLQHFLFPNCELLSDPFTLYGGRIPVIQQCGSRLSTVHPALAEVLVQCCSPDPADRHTPSEVVALVKVCSSTAGCEVHACSCLLCCDTAVVRAFSDTLLVLPLPLAYQWYALDR